MNVRMSENERILIIPDIHNAWHVAERIIRNERPDRTVLLGDYFDDFGDDWRVARNTAKWLKESLRDKTRTHLIGNHDLGYMAKNPYLRWSGYDGAKHVEIQKVGIDWNMLRMYCWVDGWLCTHAGLSGAFLSLVRKNPGDSVEKVLGYSWDGLGGTLTDDAYDHQFFQAGYARGGNFPAGGPLWCDYDEFVDVPGTRQIFGHTRAQAVRHEKRDDTEHYCIDTGLWNYAVHEDGKMKIFDVPTPANARLQVATVHDDDVNLRMFDA